MPKANDDGMQAPKGKITAYAFFIRHQHEVNKDIKIPFSEFSKQCSALWKGMTGDDKGPFQTLADSDKVRYEEELVQFKRNGGVIVSKKSQKANSRKALKEAKDPNHPKRPRTGFFLFSTDYRGKIKEQNPDFKVTDIARELGKLWRGIDEPTKQHYQTLSEQERNVYTEKMRIYNANKQEEERLRREQEQELQEQQAKLLREQLYAQQQQQQLRQQQQEEAQQSSSPGSAHQQGAYQYESHQQLMQQAVKENSPPPQQPQQQQAPQYYTYNGCTYIQVAPGQFQQVQIQQEEQPQPQQQQQQQSYSANENYNTQQQSSRSMANYAYANDENQYYQQ